MSAAPSFAALAEAVRLDRLRQYVPGPKQRAFHASRHPRRMLRAGNQTGKTYAGAAEAWWHAIRMPGSVGLVLCADWTSYRDVVSAKMYELAPLHLIDASSDYNTSRGWKNQQIQLKNGSLILFRSAESASTSIAGLTLDWLWIDEPPPAHLFGEALSRVAVTRGDVWMTFTPIGRPVAYLRAHVEGTEDEPPREEWEQHIIRLSPEDCPHRSPESIEAQVAGYGPWEYDQRVNGAWEGETHDRRFTDFSEACVFDGDELPEVDEIRVGIDHGEGDRKQCAYVVGVRGARSLSPEVHVLAEYVASGGSGPAEDAQGIVEALHSVGLTLWHVRRVFGDINSAGKLGGGTKYNEHIEAHFAAIHNTAQSPKPIETPDKRGGSVDAGEAVLSHAMRDGRFRVHSSCGHLVNALRHYRGPKDADLKDPIDAVRYAVGDILLTARNRAMTIRR